MPQSTPSPRRSPPRRSPPRRRRTLRPRSTSIARQLRMNTPPSTPDNRRGLFGTPNNVSPPHENRESLTPEQRLIMPYHYRDEKNDKINRADVQSLSPPPPNEEEIQRGTLSPQRETPSPRRTPSHRRTPSPRRPPSPRRRGGKSRRNKSRRNKSRRNKSRRRK